MPRVALTSWCGGFNIEGQEFCHEMGLYPEWPGPAKAAARRRDDWSGWRMSQVAGGKRWLGAFEESL
jgi:hypothetical protein